MSPMFPDRKVFIKNGALHVISVDGKKGLSKAIEKNVIPYYEAMTEYNRRFCSQ